VRFAAAKKSQCALCGPFIRMDARKGLLRGVKEALGADADKAIANGCEFFDRRFPRSIRRCLRSPNTKADVFPDLPA